MAMMMAGLEGRGWTGQPRTSRRAEVVVSAHKSKSAPQGANISTEEPRQSGPIDIEFRGHRLTIRSDRDPDFVRDLVQYLDDTFGELQSAAPSVPSNKLMVLAGMTVVEELFEARDELQQMRAQIQETTRSMVELIDQVEET